MAENIGSIVVSASINTKDYDAGKKHIEKGNKELDDGAKDTSSRFAGAWSVAGTAVLATLAAVSAATIATVTSSVKSFAEYEQLIGGVDTLFKDSSKTVQEYAANAYKTAGLSANEYMSTVTSFSASLLQGLGGDTVAASKIANLAITDMSDNANKLGTSMELIQNAYQGFAKDNFTMLDNLKLGYGGTATEMARLVNDSGVLGSSFKATAENVSDIPFDKLIQAINVVQTELGITGTTALEASTTIQGSWLALGASWQNLLTGMADPKADLMGLIDQFVGTAVTFGDNVLPAIEKALDGVVVLAAQLLPKIVEMLPGLLDKLLPAIITATIGLLTTVIQTIPKLIPVLVRAVTQLLFGILNAIPAVLPAILNGIISIFNGVIKIITTPGLLSKIVIAALELFMGIVQALPLVVDSLIQALPLLIAATVGYLTDPAVIKQLIKASVILFGALIAALPQVMVSLLTALGTLITELWQRLQNNFTRFGTEFGRSIGDAVKSGINGVLGWIESQVNWIIDKINGMMKAIDDVVPGDQSGARIPKLSIPKLASGGVTQGPTLAMIGEGREQEAVLPLSKLDAMLNMSNNNDKAGDTFQITVNASADMIRSENDKREFATMIVDAFNQTRKAKGLPALG